jgi:hypothetical protein
MTSRISVLEKQRADSGADSYANQYYSKDYIDFTSIYRILSRYHNRFSPAKTGICPSRYSFLIAKDADAIQQEKQSRESKTEQWQCNQFNGLVNIFRHQ